MPDCPLCDFTGLAASDLRCPNCQQALTDWKNLDHYAATAHRAGLHALVEQRLDEALSFFVKAAVMRPDDPLYLGSYGRLLGRLGRYDEAAAVLRRATARSPRDQSLTAALATAEKLATEAPAETAEIETPPPPPVPAATGFGAPAPAPAPETPGDDDGEGIPAGVHETLDDDAVPAANNETIDDTLTEPDEVPDEIPDEAATTEETKL